MDPITLHLFQQVADGLHALLPDDLGEWHERNHRYGLKLWFGPAAKPDKEHDAPTAAAPLRGSAALARREGSRRPGTGGRSAPKEHYEAQVVGAKHVPGASVLAMEVGFHAEHPDPARNEAALARLGTRWRKAIGPEAVAGPFLGNDGGWLRLSETWPDPDLGDPDLAFEVAARLADYATALEPLRRKG